MLDRGRIRNGPRHLNGPSRNLELRQPSKMNLQAQYRPMSHREHRHQAQKYREQEQDSRRWASSAGERSRLGVCKPLLHDIESRSEVEHFDVDLQSRCASTSRRIQIPLAESLRFNRTVDACSPGRRISSLSTPAPENHHPTLYTSR